MKLHLFKSGCGLKLQVSGDFLLCSKNSHLTQKNLNNALYLSIRGHLTEKPPVCKSTTKWYKLYKVAPWEEVFTCQAADFFC